MTRRRLLGLVVILASLTAAGMLQHPIQKRRAVLRLTVSPDVYDSLPPRVAFTQVLLGGFRGLAVDFLWARSTKLQVQGKYHEALQLAEWITTLQPHFSGVWQFQAHNLAYDVADSTNLPPDRWHWVEAGMALIRDDALQLNPTDRGLHRYLAWLFYDKIGSDRDLTHLYFKNQFARQWDELLGAPPAAGADVAAWLEPHRAALVEQGMDPGLMADLVGECGPLDWRHPAAHSLYWLLQGALRETLHQTEVRLGEKPLAEDVGAALALFYGDTRTTLAAQDLVLGGRVAIERGGVRCRYQPDTRLLDFLERVEKGFLSKAFRQGIAPERFERVLTQLVSWYHFEGDAAAAEVWRARLQRDFSRGEYRTEKYALAVEPMLVESLVHELEGGEHLRTLVNLQIYHSLQKGIAVERPDVARRYHQFAQLLLEYGRMLAPEERAHLADIEQLFIETVADYMIAPVRSGTPQDKSAVWGSLTAELRTLLFPEVQRWTYPQARREGLDPEVLFPESP